MIDQEETIQNNTIATIENTEATRELSRTEFRAERVKAIVCMCAIGATCYLSYLNSSFAENQAGLVLSAVIGGIFATSATKR